MPSDQRSEGAPSAKSEQPTPKVDLAVVRALAETFAIAHGVELFDVEWTSARAGNVLRVSIERPLAAPSDGPDDNGEPGDGPPPICAGVTIADCARLSRDLSTALDAEEVIAPRYTLEVSSPGADRPLRGEMDMRRYVGRIAKLKLAEPAADGQLVLRGAILSAADGVIQMEVDGNHHDVALDNVAQANLVVDLGAQKKGAKRRPGRQRRSRSGRRAETPEEGGPRPGREQAEDQGVRHQDGSNE
jgi:ribosome maturation factor RimP